MNNWRIVGKIAVVFGIVSVLFAVFSAIIVYNGMNLQPEGYYSAAATQLNIISSMLPYLFYTALSFVVAGLTLRVGKEDAKEKMPSKEQTTLEATMEKS
jgi:hypothetical protein